MAREYWFRTTLCVALEATNTVDIFKGNFRATEEKEAIKKHLQVPEVMECLLEKGGRIASSCADKIPYFIAPFNFDGSVFAYYPDEAPGEGFVAIKIRSLTEEQKEVLRSTFSGEATDLIEKGWQAHKEKSTP